MVMKGIEGGQKGYAKTEKSCKVKKERWEESNRQPTEDDMKMQGKVVSRFAKKESWKERCGMRLKMKKPTYEMR